MIEMYKIIAADVLLIIMVGVMLYSMSKIDIKPYKILTSIYVTFIPIYVLIDILAFDADVIADIFAGSIIIVLCILIYFIVRDDVHIDSKEFY